MNNREIDRLAEIRKRWSLDNPEPQHGKYGIAQQDITYLIRRVELADVVIKESTAPEDGAFDCGCNLPTVPCAYHKAQLAYDVFCHEVTP